jgi:hypothetical protein
VAAAAGTTTTEEEEIARLEARGAIGDDDEGAC